MSRGAFLDQQEVVRIYGVNLDNRWTITSIWNRNNDGDVWFHLERSFPDGTYEAIMESKSSLFSKLRNSQLRDLASFLRREANEDVQKRSWVYYLGSEALHLVE
jgi:hypothetical protein